jgi:hypothetical protein
MSMSTWQDTTTSYSNEKKKTWDFYSYIYSSTMSINILLVFGNSLLLLLFILLYLICQIACIPQIHYYLLFSFFFHRPLIQSGASLLSRATGRMRRPMAKSCCHTFSGVPEQSKLTTGTCCSRNQSMVA